MVQYISKHLTLVCCQIKYLTLNAYINQLNLHFSFGGMELTATFNARAIHKVVYISILLASHTKDATVY